MSVSVRKISKDTVVMFVNRGVGLISGLILMAFFTRRLGVSEYGVYSLVTTLICMLSITADFGLSMLVVREVAKDPSKLSKYYINGLLAKLFLISINILLLYAIVLFLDKGPHVNAALFAGVVLLLATSFSEYNLSILASRESFKLYGILQIAENALWLCTGLVLIHYSKSAFVLIIGLSFVKLIFLLSSGLIVYKYFYNKAELSLSFIISFLKDASPFFVFMVLGVIYFSVDTIMITRMLENSEYHLGIYLAAVKIVTILLIIPSVISQILFPAFSKLHVVSPSTLRAGVKELTRYMQLLSVPIAIGTTLLADKIILLLFGEDFISSVLPLQILIWILPLRFNNFIFGTVLTSTTRQISRTVSAGACVGVNIGLNFILIPLYGIIGASVTTVFTEIVLFGLYFYFMGEDIRTWDLVKTVWRPLLGSAVFAGFLFFFGEINLFISIIPSVVIYFAIIYLFKGFQEIKLVTSWRSL